VKEMGHSRTAALKFKKRKLIDYIFLSIAKFHIFIEKLSYISLEMLF